MLVPVLVFFVCFGVGVTAASRWLPDLAPGPVGGLAFFIVVGLLSAALSLAGLHVYSVVRALETRGSGLGLAKGEILAGGMGSILLDAGMLTGLASIVFLLAPALEDEIAGQQVLGDEATGQPTLD